MSCAVPCGDPLDALAASSSVWNFEADPLGLVRGSARQESDTIPWETRREVNLMRSAVEDDVISVHQFWDLHRRQPTAPPLRGRSLFALCAATDALDVRGILCEGSNADQPPSVVPRLIRPGLLWSLG